MWYISSHLIGDLIGVLRSSGSFGIKVEVVLYFSSWDGFVLALIGRPTTFNESFILRTYPSLLPSRSPRSPTGCTKVVHASSDDITHDFHGSATLRTLGVDVSDQVIEVLIEPDRVDWSVIEFNVSNPIAQVNSRNWWQTLPQLLEYLFS